MNNSSVSRSNHSTRVLVSICFVILLCVVIALWFSKVNAANIVRRTVSMYLDEKQISYTSVHVNNQTLSVELQSSGEGRCTLDDVKAIQNIYTVIHAQSLADKIRNVKIEIVDRTGTVTSCFRQSSCVSEQLSFIICFPQFFVFISSYTIELLAASVDIHAL